jgi:hypothetical protein
LKIVRGGAANAKMGRTHTGSQIGPTMTESQNRCKNYNHRKTGVAAFGRKPDQFNFPKKCGGLPTRRYDEPGFSEAPIHPAAPFAFPNNCATLNKDKI